jgi:hypothetical protein
VQCDDEMQRSACPVIMGMVVNSGAVANSNGCTAKLGSVLAFHARLPFWHGSHMHRTLGATWCS